MIADTEIREPTWFSLLLNMWLIILLLENRILVCYVFNGKLMHNDSMWSIGINSPFTKLLDRQIFAAVAHAHNYENHMWTIFMPFL